MTKHNFAGGRVNGRHQAPLEMASGRRSRRALMAACTPGVELFTREVLEGGDQVGADSLRYLEGLLAKRQVSAVGAATVGSHGNPRHGLYSTGDDSALHA